MQRKIIYKSLITFLILTMGPHQALAYCSATEQCQGMGLDPNTICSPLNETACRSNSCCMWFPDLNPPTGWMSTDNSIESTNISTTGENNGPKLKIPELEITLPGLLFSDENKIQSITEGDKTFFYVPWIGEYINWLYNYSIGIIALLALLAIIIGGFYWIIAGGNASRVSEAKSWINAAISGLVLALTSYLLLFTINSNLVKLPPIKMMAIKTIPLEYEIPSEWQTPDAPISGTSTHGVPLYYQCSEYAKSIHYPTKNGKCADSTLCSSGCGVLATFMAINKSTKTKDLREFTQEAINYGARETFNGKECNGSTASGLIKLAQSYGLDSNYVNNNNTANEISNYLDRGCVVVISVGFDDKHSNCKFTNGGHFIVLTGWRDRSKQIVDVNDPFGDKYRANFPGRGDQDKTKLTLGDWGGCRLSQKFYVCEK